MAFIETHNTAFLTALESLLDRINDVVSEYMEDNEKSKESMDTEAFKTKLVSLKTALENMDASVINQTVDNLQKVAYKKDTGAAIRDLSNKILMAEYDESIELIESLLQKV